MTDPLNCGSIRERVDNCSDLKTRGECQPNDTGYWMNVNGKTHLCEWNPSRNQCVYGPSCECPAAPFSLNLFGFESGSPTSCEDLNSEQCDYFETTDGRRCIQNIMGQCKDPPDTEPSCTDFNLEDEFAATDDSCPYGTKDDCQTICKNKNSNFTGPASTILEYGCGTFGHGYGRYCMCSYPSQ